MCFLEVDLAYPDEVACYPLAKEKIEVRKEMLSDYQLRFIEENNFSYDKNKKPISNLGDQIKYKLHYQNLRVYLSFGLELKKNHRTFKQKPILKSYIEHNTDLQKEAEKEGNKINKQNGKLRNNAIFGKSIKNPMSKVDMKQ